MHGKDPFLRAEYTRGLRAELEKAHGELEVSRFDGQSDALADVLDECRSFGLMSGHKLVVLDAAEQLVNESTRPMLDRYAEQPAEGATLVLRAETWRPGNLDKKVALVGAVVKCEPPREDQAARWAELRAKKTHGATLEADASRMLVDYFGPDLGRLDSELGKLAVAASAAGGTITTALIERMCRSSRPFDPWSVQGEVLSPSVERAVSAVRRRVAETHKDQSVPVSIALVQLAAKLHGVAAGVHAGENPEKLAKTYKLWGESKSAIQSAARSLGPDRARALFRRALDVDQGLKQGLGRADRSLEVLAAEIAQAMRETL
ncbi:MAG: DNA polymerase III subunit delta [Planctomycetota bacterium]